MLAYNQKERKKEEKQINNTNKQKTVKNKKEKKKAVILNIINSLHQQYSSTRWYRCFVSFLNQLSYVIYLWFCCDLVHSWVALGIKVSNTISTLLHHWFMVFGKQSCSVVYNRKLSYWISTKLIPTEGLQFIFSLLIV